MFKLFNSLTRQIEEFKPINPAQVGMYTCGPTVYDYAHIGNFRTYTTSDILLRVLKYNGFDVKHVMNITDVGHLTGDNIGDADFGEDRMEKSAKKEGKSAWEIAQFYTEAFLKDFDRLTLEKPFVFAKATEHIKEQIDLIKKLEEKGFTYATDDGIYFDTTKFPDYGKLSTLDEIKAGARVDLVPGKKSHRDFALWKFSKPDERRHMEWDSPWGVGFPGWHIECSAMSMKYLGEHLDIHVGGMDLRSTHHPNEIAQSEAATGKPFVNYWVHGAFILVEGQRMSKSLGNNYTVDDLLKHGFHPLALRYLYLQTHYRQEMNFTLEALEGAQNALNRLQKELNMWEEPKIGCAGFEEDFLKAVNDDLNMPQALSLVWELVKSDYPASAKAQSLLKMDQVLGLGLKQLGLQKEKKIPDEVLQMIREREQLRKQKRYHLADQLRDKIRKLGYEISDKEDGSTDIEKI